MTTDTAPDSVYAAFLAGEAAEAYAAATAITDLSDEIRLLRAALALAGPGQIREVTAAVSALKGILEVQCRLTDPAATIEQELTEAAERVLQRFERAEESEDRQR